MALIGLDIGTTGTKAVVFTEEGKIVASAYREYDIVSPQPGWYELEPLRIWEAAQEVLREAAPKAGHVSAICTSSLGESCVCF